MLNGKLAPILCDLLKCKKRLCVEKTVKVTLCEKRKCKNLDLNRLQCRLAPRRSRVAFGKPSGTLRMHKGSDKGWHYREM
jgi:hypothetical protein